MTGAPLLLTRECANRKDYVEIDAPKFTDGIGVTLQSVNKDGQRREMLESFRGVARYGLDGLDSGSYLETLAAMREDFEKYAIPWYSGRLIETPAIQARHRRSDSRAYSDAASMARVSFKRRDYDSAIGFFEKAAAIKPLSVIDLNFLDAARKFVGIKSSK
jgi:hypothetical protein